MDRLVFKGHYVPPKPVDRSGIVAGGVVDLAQVHAGHHLEADIPKLGTDGERTLARLDGSLIVAADRKRVGHVTEDACQPTSVAEAFGERFGVPHLVHNRSDCSGPEEAAAKVEPEIDRELNSLTSLRLMPQRPERLFEVRHCLSVSRTLYGLLAGLATVSDGFLPDLPAHGVMSQPVDLFCQAVRVQAFDGFHDPGMQRSAPLLEQATVSDLVGEGVLERV